MEKNLRSNKRTWVSLVFILVCAGIIGGFFLRSLNVNYDRSIEKVKSEYIHEEEAKANELVLKIESQLGDFYRGLRTMTFLPGVRKIDRYGKNFSGDSKEALQQIYNNTYLTVNLSEVYILPKSLDPHKVDPITKKNEEPIMTFDEFITVQSTGAKKEEDEAGKLEEVEIYEYELMKTQLELLSAKYPTNKAFEGLNVPGVIGPPVITCDNSEFTKADLEAKNDKPRMGIVYTLPVYGPAGEFSGAIAGIVRLNILEKILPEGDVGLVNLASSVRLVKNPRSAWLESEEYFRQNSVDPKLIFSVNKPIKVVDEDPWQLWIAKDNADFWNREDVTQIQTIYKNSLLYGTIGFLMLVGFIAWIVVSQIQLNDKVTRLKLIAEQLTQAAQKADRVSKDLNDSAKASSDSASSHAFAISKTVAGMDEMTSMMAQNASACTRGVEIASTAKTESEQGQDVMKKMGNAMREIEQSNRELEGIVEIISNIRSKTKVINDIVLETKFLSFNASIEAARAGVHGQGFSVVAEEVGKLANMSGRAAQEINQLLDSSSDQVKNIFKNTSERVSVGRETADRCVQMFASVNSKLGLIAEQMDSISTATREQEIGVKQANLAMNEMDQLTQSNSKNASHLSENSRQLFAIVGDISSSVQEMSGIFGTSSTESFAKNVFSFRTQKNSDENVTFDEPTKKAA